MEAIQKYLNELPEELDCGCKVAKGMFKGERILFYEPCDMHCSNFLYTQRKMRELSTKILKAQGHFNKNGRAVPNEKNNSQ